MTGLFLGAILKRDGNVRRRGATTLKETRYGGVGCNARAKMTVAAAPPRSGPAFPKRPPGFSNSYFPNHHQTVDWFSHCSPEMPEALYRSL
jgi:hypothetical protein